MVDFIGRFVVKYNEIPKRNGVISIFQEVSLRWTEIVTLRGDYKIIITAQINCP